MKKTFEIYFVFGETDWDRKIACPAAYTRLRNIKCDRVVLANGDERFRSTSYTSHAETQMRIYDPAKVRYIPGVEIDAEDVRARREEIRSAAFKHIEVRRLPAINPAC